MHHRGSWCAAALGLLAACALALSLADCGASQPGGSSGTLTRLTVGLTYVPNIQFAPFYVAEQLGYYRDAGLDVTLHHHPVGASEFGAVLAGQEQAIFAGGDEVSQARAKGAPLVYVAEIFRQYPVTLVVPAGSPIHSAADLRGRTVGVPGEYGATYIGLLALLHSAGLSASEVNIQSIGYTQVPALMTHRVDAVMGYVNNEPIEFQQAHFAVRTLDVSSVQPLISDGLAATASELRAQPAAIRALIAATQRGVAYTIAHPRQALDISKSYVPGLSDPQQATAQLAVLEATIPVMRLDGARAGYNDPAAWQSMVSFLEAVGQLPPGFDTTAAYSNAYLPAS